MGMWKCHKGLGYGDGKALIIDMLKYVLGMCWVFVTQLKAYIVYGGGVLAFVPGICMIPS